MGDLDWEMDFSGLDAFEAALPEVMPIALMRAAEHVRGVAVALTPIEEGDLRGSAGARMVGQEARIEYNSVYARYQHYGLDFRHPRGGQALFLEQPMVTEAAAVQQIMADTFREATGL
jgi:hypothetical protein